jgi:hypothetical protein
MGTLRPGQWTTRELLEDYADADVRDAAWYRFVTEVRTLRDSGSYRWADEQLARIAAIVERSQMVTPRQRALVDRIVAAEYAPGRAFDKFGFGRRW